MEDRDMILGLLGRHPLGDRVRFVAGHLLYSDRLCFVLEFPPVIRTLDRDGVWYRHALPYSVACVLIGISEEASRLANMALFFRKAPLTESDMDLGHPKLPNVTRYGWVCLGSACPEARRREECLDVAFEAYELIWSSQFNNHVEYNTLHGNRWESLTERDPYFAISYDWPIVCRLPEILKTYEVFYVR